MKTILFCLLAIASVLSQSPGFKTVITQNGLTYLEEVGVNYLAQSLISLPIPDQSGDAGLLFIFYSSEPFRHPNWTCRLDSYRNRCNSIYDRRWRDYNSTRHRSCSILVTFVFSLISPFSTNINIVMGSNWSYRKNHWPHVSDHGTADVVVENTNINVNLQITETNGRPLLTVLADSIDIGKLV